MQKGLGIAALVLAIVAIFIPVVGTWITIPAGLLAAFAAGNGFSMGIAAIVINAIHIMFLSPLLWATRALDSAGAANLGRTATAEINFLPWALLAVQAIVLVVLIMVNMKSTSKEATSN